LEILSDNDNINPSKYELLVKNHSKNVFFYYLWFLACKLKNDLKKAGAVLEKAISIFPDDLFIVTNYTFLFLSSNNIKKVERKLKGRYFIKDYAQAKKYTFQEVVDFYSVMAWYYLLKDDVRMADQYLFAIDHIVEWAKDYSIWETAILAIIKYKFERFRKQVDDERIMKNSMK
jgi:tetratricopeptide (TPR) repeat protein